MYCEKYKAGIPEKTCLARQDKHLGNNAFGRQALDPGCQNCDQGRQVMVNFKKNQKTEENMSDITKICKKCEEPKLADKNHFYGDKRNPDGLGNWCKDCHDASSRKTKKTRPAPAGTAASDKAATGKKKPEQRLVLTIDFSGRQDLLEDIREAAENEFRTPEMQVLWWLSTPKETTRSL